MFERAARHAHHLRANADAPFIERLDRHLVALAHFAQHVGLGNAAIFQNQFARGRGADAELVLFLPHGESGRLCLHQKRGDAFVAQLAVDGGEHDEQAGFLGVGDPKFAAIQNKMVAVFFGPRRQAKSVAAGVGLGQSVGAHGVVRQARQECFLLCSLPQRIRALVTSVF